MVKDGGSRDSSELGVPVRMVGDANVACIGLSDTCSPVGLTDRRT